MARIRTIKPELWTDPEFTECSLSARLLFIAMLNFSTDYGVLPDKPRQIKMQCLPADNIDAEPLIEELIHNGFVIRRCAPNGDKVLVIRTFSKNQKINRATPGRWGNPAEWDYPQGSKRKNHGALSEDSVSPTPRKGRDNSEGEGKGREHRHSTRSTGTQTDDVLTELATIRLNGKTPDNPAAYRTKLTSNLRAEHHERITQLCAQFPNAPATVCNVTVALVALSNVSAASGDPGVKHAGPMQSPTSVTSPLPPPVLSSTRTQAVVPEQTPGEGQ